METHIPYETLSDGTFCYLEELPAGVRFECANADGEVGRDELEGAQKTVIRRSPDGTMYRILDRDTGISVRFNDEDLVVPGCVGLSGAFALGRCIGVVASSCGGEHGMWITMHEDGSWSEPVGLPFDNDGNWLTIDATSCDSWTGVWGWTRPDVAVTGPVTITLEHGEIVRSVRSSRVLGTPSIGANGTELVAIRIGSLNQPELVHYDLLSSEETVIDRAREFQISADTGTAFGKIVFASTWSDEGVKVFYTEVSLHKVEGVKIAELVSGTFAQTNLESDAPMFFSELLRLAPDPIPWSAALTPDGTWIVDLSRGDAASRSGHLRVRRTEACLE